jgi:hypothetical protein
MKFNLNFEKGKGQIFQISYKQEEWETIENKMTNLGLVKAKTKNAWGLGINMSYYKETKLELKKFIEQDNSCSHAYTDAVNKPFISDVDIINLAIIRAIPIKATRSDRYVTSVELDKYLTVVSLKKITDSLVYAYTKLLNILTDKVHINVDME